MAFYKLNPETGGLQRAVRYVANKDYVLRANREADKLVTNNKDGWRWFDTAQEAIAHFGIETFSQFRRRRALEIIAEQGIDLRQEYRDLLLQGDDTD